MLIDEICKKAGQKLNDLSRVKPYIDLSERLMMVNTLSLTQFSYCASVWMCHSRTKNKINCLYERCQRPVHNGKQIIMNYWKGIVLYCSVYTKTKPVFPSTRNFQVNERNCSNYRELISVKADSYVWDNFWQLKVL